LSPLAQSLIATLLVSLTSFVAIVFAFSDLWTERRQMLLLSFAAGVLLSTVFLELFPEAVEQARGDGNIFVATLAAMIGFFFLERFLQGFHAHEEGRAMASRYLVLIGNGVHNFIDGVVVAASFIASPALGIATTLAVVAHEIPHEIADYAILIRSKLSPRNALIVNFLSGLTALAGVFACFELRTLVQAHLGWFLTATAGMFIYIAASDLIPELHTHEHRNQWVYTAPFVLGIALMAILGAVVTGRH
jgi:zinc and cadmium transporter